MTASNDRPGLRIPGMTPTGRLLCAFVLSVVIFLPGPDIIPVVPLCVVGCYVLCEQRGRALRAVGFSLLVVAPVALYLSFVWILIVGKSPAGSRLYSHGQHSAIEYVVTLSSKLLLFSVLCHSSVMAPFSDGALAFLVESRLPRMLKVVIALTLSTASTIKVGAERAWVSLVSANLLAPRLAWKNVRNCGLFMQTVWLSILGTVSARLQTKWMIEDVRVRMDEMFSSAGQKPLASRDLLWLGGGVATAMLSVVRWLR